MVAAGFLILLKVLPMAKKRGAGEGTVSRRKKDGRWTGAITVGVDTNGKRIRKWFYGDTRGEVVRQLARLQNQKLDGVLRGTDQTKLGDYLDGWIETDTRLSPTTRLRYSDLARLHINPRMGGMKITNVSAATIEAFMGALVKAGVGQETRLKCYSVLHRGFQRLVKQRRLFIHPCAGVDRPRVERIKRPSLDADQSEDLLTAVKNHRLAAIFMLAITTGMRQGEIFGLQWDDVDLARGIITVKHSLEEIKGKLRLKPPKSAAGLRSVKLSKLAVDALQERWAMAMEEDAAGVPFVFCDTQGNPLRKSNFRRREWAAAKKAAGLPEGLRFHDLRHTNASLLLKSNVHVKVVSERLGHSDIRLTLNTYSHILAGMQDTAADAFDNLFSADGCQMVVKPGSDASPETTEPWS